MSTRKRVLWVVAVAQAMIAIDSTVMNVALPTMRAELGFADGARHWVITAYALTFGALLLPGSGVGAAGLFSVFLFVVYFLQGPLRFDPIESSLAIMPFPVVATASSILLAPYLSRLMGARGALVSAALLATAGMGWVAVGAHDPNYALSRSLLHWSTWIPPLPVFNSSSRRRPQYS